jgi:hypothetical protein
MNREQSLRALAELAASPAAKWIGNKLDVDNTLLIKCTRCGAEDRLKMPSNVHSPLDVPAGFDEKLFAFKRGFQIAHESCLEERSEN